MSDILPQMIPSSNGAGSKRDQVRPYTCNNINNRRYEANQKLYQIYHESEINSIGYPNNDNNIWDNNTKEVYNTIDKRSGANLTSV